MSYQSFPWQGGDSKSFEKLTRLYLPNLKSRTVLDVGCNTGFFCGWAAFQGASYIMGVDKNADFIASARTYFPTCVFQCAAWDSLTSQTFDVVLCLSALHYAADQKEMIDRLMSYVDKAGILVLELGIADGEDDTFIEVRRSIDTRFFPTRTKLHSILSPYIYKQIGHSVLQSGDPTPRYVYHIYHKKPYAVLMMDGHYSGKTSVSKRLFNEDIARIHGDSVYSRILNGQIAVDKKLQDAVHHGYCDTHFDSAKATAHICKTGLLDDVLRVFLDTANGQDFVLDHYIPVAFHDTVCDFVYNSGYFVIYLGLWQGRVQDWKQERVPARGYERYLKFLRKEGLINEDDYLEANPDVARAIAEGRMPNAQYHYFHFGRLEGRRLRKIQ